MSRSPVRTALAGAVFAHACALLAMASPPAAAQERSPLVWAAMLERLEYRAGDGSRVGAWDGDAWAGTDEWKLRLQSQGEYTLDGSAFETLEHQLLVQHPVSDFFDVKAGVRVDTPEGPDRVYGVLGLQGLAPQWFEVDADLFLGQGGKASARIDVDYELLITNRLILTPSVEADFAFTEDRAVGVGTGLGKVELGARLSYDLVDRLVAPYIGIHYERLFGSTRRFARADGEPGDNLYLVAGVRLRF